MKDTKNIGDIDAALRLGGGFSLLGIGITKKSTLMILSGSIMIAEGITRFSPAFYILGLSTYNENINIRISKEFD